jgi:hypothetical protein
MTSSLKHLPCDGCSLPANPEHIAARIRRLELATRFRPIHIGILFVATAPASRPEDDFYSPPASKQFFDPFMEALEISAGKATLQTSPQAPGVESLVEFQRRGHFLAYLSECPLPADGQASPETIARLAPNLLRRIRFNYKPKYVALLGQELAPLVEVLRNAGIGPSLILNQGLPLPFPSTGDQGWKALLQSAVATVSPSQNLASGYDRIDFNLEVRNSGAGGGT